MIEGTHKAPPNPEEETREASSDPGMETHNVAGLAAGSTNLEGLVVPRRRTLTISGNLPPNNAIAHVESAGASRRGRSSTQSFLLTTEEGDEESTSMCGGEGLIILQRKVEIPESIARGMSPEQ